MHFLSSTVVVALATLHLVPAVIASPRASSDLAPATEGITAPRGLELIERDDDDHHDLHFKDDDEHQVWASVEKAFSIIDSIPDEVLEKGDDATDKWLIAHGHRTPNSKKTPPTLRRDPIQNREAGSIADLVERSFWSVARCVGAITAFIASNAVGAAKLLRIKKYIKALGGIRKSAKLLLKASNNQERLKEGGEALLLLAGEILGTSSIANNC